MVVRAFIQEHRKGVFLSNVQRCQIPAEELLEQLENRLICVLVVIPERKLGVDAAVRPTQGLNRNLGVASWCLPEFRGSYLYDSILASPMKPV